MKYIIYNERTGELVDIVSTILENRPMIMPMFNPFDIENYCLDNCQVDDKEKASRALGIFVRDREFDRYWSIKEIGQ